jgi:hypothetical protein
MKRSKDKRRTTKPRSSIGSELDAYKWATKMEIRRLLSGKPDLTLKEDSKKTD